MIPNDIRTTFRNMMSRCYNPNHRRYKDYGGRGLTVCGRWQSGGVNVFYSDMGERPKGYHLDRIDNNAGYAPENCKWVPLEESMRNRRRSGRFPIVSSGLVDLIRADLAHVVTLESLSVEYGLSFCVIREIIYNRSYKRPIPLKGAGTPRGANWEIAEEIRNRWNNRITIRHLSAKYRIPVKFIGQIKRRRGAYK